MHASIPQPQEETLDNVGSSRSAEKYVLIVLAIRDLRRAWVQTLKTESSISRWQLATSFEDTMANFENLAALLQQKEHRRRPMRVRSLKTEPCISQRRLATTSRK